MYMGPRRILLRSGEAASCSELRVDLLLEKIDSEVTASPPFERDFVLNVGVYRVVYSEGSSYFDEM